VHVFRPVHARARAHAAKGPHLPHSAAGAIYARAQCQRLHPPGQNLRQPAPAHSRLFARPSRSVRPDPSVGIIEFAHYCKRCPRLRLPVSAFITTRKMLPFRAAGRAEWARQGVSGTGCARFARTESGCTMGCSTERQRARAWEETAADYGRSQLEQWTTSTLAVTRCKKPVRGGIGCEFNFQLAPPPWSMMEGL
jgi:hypothetical protein